MKNAYEKITNRTFGMEIEVETITKLRATQIVAQTFEGTIRESGTGSWRVIDNQGRIWKVVNDGSLDGVDSGEIVTPILTLADLPTLQELIRNLRRARATVSSRTGAHIHIGASDLTPAQIANLVKIFYKQEQLIYKACGVLGCRLAHYTRPTDRGFINRISNGKIKTDRDLNIAWFGFYNPNPIHYDQHRYRALNLNNLWNEKKTVEFRLFNGTLHAGEVKANILLALTLVNMAKEAKSASSKQREVDTSTSKYDLRCFLLRLGMIGEEFKTARLHLAKRLGGSTAWKGERRD